MTISINTHTITVMNTVRMGDNDEEEDYDGDDHHDDLASQVCGGGIDNIDHHPQRQRRHRLNIHGFDDDRENFDDFVDE